MEVDAISEKPKVVILGPEGTYSEEAAMNYWKEEAEYIYAKDFTEIFEKTREADYGTVPTGDSESGDVLESLDLLEDYSLRIVGELYHEVKHFLLGKETIDKLKVIGSHKKPLTHCRKYLFTHFHDLSTPIEMDSTAAAAEKASKDPTFGAISSERNAKVYGLNILASEIHDKGSNKTRWLVLSTKEKSFSDISRDSPIKTSICVHIKKDKPGVLAEILNIFTKKKINLTRIVSRPDGGDIEHPKFFIDLEGGKDLPKVKSALQELENLKSVKYYRDFGSYPNLTKEELQIEETQPSSLELLESTFDFWDNEKDQIYDTL